MRRGRHCSWANRQNRDALYRCGAPAGQRVRLAAHCGAGPHAGDHRFLGRHRQHPSAAHQGPVQPGPRGLPCHGIHLRGPQPRPETGLYRRAEPVLQRRSTTAAMSSFPALPWAARRRCCILSARSRTRAVSTATITSPSLWTARWPANPPRSSGKTLPNATTTKPSPWCRAAKTRCSSPVCRSAKRKRNPLPSTATRRPRSSSPPPACATRAASATTSSITSGAGVHGAVRGLPVPRHLGRALINGAQEVKLFGEPVQVKAAVRQMGGLVRSRGPGRPGAWIRPFDAKPKMSL